MPAIGERCFDSETKAPSSSNETGFGLYIHWPFCLSKCPYCDFNSHVAENIDGNAWGAALLSELDHFARVTAGRRLTSIFFGGGTPSLMDPGIIAALIERAGERWTLDGGAEITLEANPTSAEAGKFADFRAAGVNRLSLGVQSLDDDALRFLGRGHDKAEALRALETARRVFPRISFDLIYALPGQGEAAWRRELEAALALAGDHMSLYQLTIEKGARLYTPFRRGAFALPGEAEAAGLFELTRETLADAGMPAYEISNHAREGGACRHNLTCWRGGDYAGIGPGAHGRLTPGPSGRTSPDGPAGRRTAFRQISAPDSWRQAVATRGHGTSRATALSAGECRTELLLTGLRLAEGVSRSRFRELTGETLEGALPRERLQRLIGGGFLVSDDRGLRATETGFLRLDAVLAELLG